MRIFKNIYIPLPYPILFIKNYNMLIISDIHLGYETYLKDKGIYIPHRTYSQLKSNIDKIISKINPTSLVILGDVKHEFGKPTSQEWIEVKELLSYLLNKGIEVNVIRGNHDNYIISILNKLNIKLYDPFMIIDNIIMFHGHKEIEIPKEIKIIIMGHEHPAISSKDLSGSRYKFKCFLVGNINKNKRIIVLPAFSPLFFGMGINEIPREELLSPLLRTIDIDKLTPIVIEEGIGVFKFPQIGIMKSL